MASEKSGQGVEKLSQVVADARRHMQARENTYRERALNMFPHVCGRCGRT